jgi:hypothetical protein
MLLPLLACPALPIDSCGRFPAGTVVFDFLMVRTQLYLRGWHTMAASLVELLSSWCFGVSGRPSVNRL